MAKQRDAAEAAGQAPAPAQVQAAPVPPAQAPADAPPREPDVVTQLRARIREQQQQLERMQSEQARAGPRETALYRVALDGAKAKDPTVTVEPHERRYRRPEGGKATHEAASYSGLALFLAGGGSREIARLAWDRYCAERQVDPRRRGEFRVRVEGGPTLDALEIPAGSPHEARHLYELYNGVLGTDRAYKVEPVGAAAAAEGEG